MEERIKKYCIQSRTFLSAGQKHPITSHYWSAVPSLTIFSICAFACIKKNQFSIFYTKNSKIWVKVNYNIKKKGHISLALNL
jgi:hypothetical protein